MSILSIFGINDAVATTATTTVPSSTGAPVQSTQSSIMSMLPMLIIFVLIFYFLLIRPQSKRAKEHRKLMETLAKGDEVLTAGGMMGKISRLEEDHVVITIANNVDITMQKNSIAAVLPKGTIKSF